MNLKNTFCSICDVVPRSYNSALNDDNTEFQKMECANYIDFKKHSFDLQASGINKAYFLCDQVECKITFQNV